MGRATGFQWLCLPQGWKHSPFLFTTCINSILRATDTDLRSLGVIARHYQDDIVLVGKDNLNNAMELLIDRLHSFGFNIRKDKCTWSTDTIIFCGYEVKAGCIQPKPKTKLENVIVEEVWKAFMTGDRVSRYNWLREWTGRFQYWRDFYSPHLSAMCLDQMYNYCKIFNDTDSDVSDLDLEQVREAFLTLIELCINCLPLPTGIGSSLKNVLVGDANSEAWGAILFKVIDDPDNKFKHMLNNLDTASGMDHWRKCASDLHQALLASDLPQSFSIIPVKLIGGIFTERQRRASSTHRERMAQLEAFSECRPLIDSPLIVVCDNLNCSLTWHCLDLFGARHLDLWEGLQSVLDNPGHIWLPRDSLPCYADCIARCISVSEKPAQTIPACTLAIASESIDNSSSDIDESNPVVQMSSHLRRDIIHGLRHDTTSTYHGHAISDIYSHLQSTSSPNEADAFSRMVYHRFKIVDGLLWFKSVMGDRCVVPNSASDHIISNANHNLRAALLNVYHDKLTHPGIFYCKLISAEAGIGRT